ncbi:MAG: hypothetical protein U0354_04300 [Candidatus Sericytochromatia bacterium]
MIKAKQRIRLKGFTIIESLVSFLILVFSITTMILMLNSGIRLQANQKNEILAQNIANEILNKEILNRKFSVISSLTNNVSNGVPLDKTVNSMLTQPIPTSGTNSLQIPAIELDVGSITDASNKLIYKDSLAKIYKSKAIIRFTPIIKDCNNCDTPLSQSFSIISIYKSKLNAEVIVSYGKHGKNFSLSYTIVNGGLGNGL